jgi:hypothetical protein
MSQNEDGNKENVSPMLMDVGSGVSDGKTLSKNFWHTGEVVDRNKKLMGGGYEATFRDIRQCGGRIIMLVENLQKGIQMFSCL